MKRKHQWKKASNSKHTYTCQLCGMKRTMRKVKGKGRFGYRFEITFHLPDGKKVILEKKHNHKTPPCKRKVMKKAA